MVVHSQNWKGVGFLTIRQAVLTEYTASLSNLYWDFLAVFGNLLKYSPFHKAVYSQSTFEISPCNNQISFFGSHIKQLYRQ